MITKQLPTHPMGITQQDQHTNIWDALQSDSPPIPGGLTYLSHPWPNPYHISVLSAKQKATIHQEGLDETATPDTTDITSGHNPGITSHTPTSGPFTRRRVMIHVEDHKPPKNQ